MITDHPAVCKYQLNELQKYVSQHKDEPLKVQAAIWAVAGILERIKESPYAVSFLRDYGNSLDSLIISQLKDRHKALVRRTSIWHRREVRKSEVEWVASEYAHFKQLAHEDVERLMNEIPGLNA